MIGTTIGMSQMQYIESWIISSMKGPQSDLLSFTIAINIKSKTPLSKKTTITIAKKILIIRSSLFMNGFRFWTNFSVFRVIRKQIKSTIANSANKDSVK